MKNDRALYESIYIREIWCLETDRPAIPSQILPTRRVTGTCLATLPSQILPNTTGHGHVTVKHVSLHVPHRDPPGDIRGSVYRRRHDRSFSIARLSSLLRSFETSQVPVHLSHHSLTTRSLCFSIGHHSSTCPPPLCLQHSLHPFLIRRSTQHLSLLGVRCRFYFIIRSIY